MPIANTASPTQPAPGLLGQTVVVIGGSSGIGLETARRARAEGAKLILAARDPERLERASREPGTLSTSAFDATNFDQLKRFFDEPGSLIKGASPSTDRTNTPHFAPK